MSSQALASVIQFYDVHIYKLQLTIQHQQVMRGLPISVQYSHKRSTVPVLAVLKLYEHSIKYKYFVLYIQPNATSVNITSTPQYCPHTASVPFLQSKFEVFIAIAVRDNCSLIAHEVLFYITFIQNSMLSGFKIDIEDFGNI
jgi:hypothetical protein